MKKPESKRPWWKKKRERQPTGNSDHYHSKEWKSFKRMFWAYPQNQYCIKCMTPRAKGFQVDHIEPLPHGITIGEFLERSSLHLCQAMCISCHSRKSAHEKTR